MFSPVPEWLWEEWSLAVIVVLSLFVFLYFPVALAQVGLLLRGLLRPGRPSHLRPVPGRVARVIVCTNGRAAEVVDRLLLEIEGYRMATVQAYVIKEAYDVHVYPCTEITVPVGYATARGSRTKERALQYGVEWGKAQGWGPETYVVHLDDDSFIDRSYLEHVLAMRAPAGQGFLRLRAHGKHMLSTIADLIRVTDCDTWCRFFNERGRPKAVHGEGLVLRADVEQEIGWDFATYCGEDFLMGQEVISRGYEFAHIPHAIRIAPPTNVRDFLRQRRRWMWGIFSSARRMSQLSRRTLAWVLYRYSVGWTGFCGVFLFAYSTLLHIYLPPWVSAASLFNMVAYFSSYQWGAFRTRLRYVPVALALQMAVAFYEGAALPYGLLFPPDRRGFDVIQKV